MKKKTLKNHDRIKRRKNFFPTLILAFVFWAFWGWVIFSLPPSNNFSLFVFFLSLFLAFFLTVSLFLANSRRGFLVALALVGFLLLRYHRLANYLNLIIFLSLVVCLEVYFGQKKS